MSFINKSVSYNQTVLLKSKCLAPLLQQYNDFYTYQASLPSITDTHWVIPNNHKKYYLFVIKKNMLEQCKEQFDILYFFPDDDSVKYYKDNKVEKHFVTDFYLEVDPSFQGSLLLEGYLYTNGPKHSFLLTDILMKNGQVVNADYNLRYCLLQELLMGTRPLVDLNDQLSISLHPVMHSDNSSLTRLFTDNFVYSTQLCAVEQVHGIVKKRYLQQRRNITENAEKRISKSKLSDVYHVFNIETGDNEGILYIKGIKESVLIKKMILGKDFIRVECKFNTIFQKWQPLI